MPKHKQTGIKGEQIAVKFLQKNGYNILHTNWRHGKKEVDIIVEKDSILVFVEVKTRNSLDFGFPEESVGHKKKGFLREAAFAYTEANHTRCEIRFDIISIILNKSEIKEIIHFEAAF